TYRAVSVKSPEVDAKLVSAIVYAIHLLRAVVPLKSRVFAGPKDERFAGACSPACSRIDLPNQWHRGQPIHALLVVASPGPRQGALGPRADLKDIPDQKRRHRPQ